MFIRTNRGGTQLSTSEVISSLSLNGQMSPRAEIQQIEFGNDCDGEQQETGTC